MEWSSFSGEDLPVIRKTLSTPPATMCWRRLIPARWQAVHSSGAGISPAPTKYC